MSVATQSITWAAGFLEGEGHFAFYGTTPQIQASQVQLDPLRKLHALFHGHVRGPYQHQNKKHSPYYEWELAGAKAVGLMMTLYTFMSPIRQTQIKKALFEWRSRLPDYQYRTHCPKGHKYTDKRDKLGKRRCQICNTLQARVRRQGNILCQ